MAEVGPVADVAVADPHEVGAPVAGHVGEVDALLAVGEHHARAGDPPRCAETALGERLVPGDGAVRGQQRVGVPVAVEVDEAQVGVVPADRRELLERAERLPVAVVGALVEARARAVVAHEVEPAVAVEVDEAAARERRLARHRLERTEPGVAEVALVEPGARLFGEHAGEAFAVEVDPAVGRPVDARGEVLEVGVRELAHRLVDLRTAVLELERRQRPAQVAAGVRPAVAAVRDRGDERADRRLAVGEIGRGDQAVGADAGLAGEVVEHQDAAAQAHRPDLEARDVGRERVGARRPRYGVADRRVVARVRIVGVVLAVVEDHLEQPAGLRERRGRDVVRPPARAVQQRCAVAIAHPLELAAGGPPRVVGGPAVALVRLREVDPGAVLGLVLVDHRVALVVAGLADQPAEDPVRVLRVADLRGGVAAEDRQLVVGRDRAPVGAAAPAVGPALDAREQALDPRPEAQHVVAFDVVLVEQRVAARVGHELAVLVEDERGDEILGAGEDEHVGLLVVGVAGEALVGLARDRRQREPPAEAERPVAVAGVVGQRQLRAEVAAAAAGLDRDLQRGGAGHRVGGELLSDAADRTAALRQARGGRGLPAARSAGVGYGRVVRGRRVHCSSGRH